MGRSKDGVSEAARRIEESHEQEMRFLRGWRERAEERTRRVGQARPRSRWFRIWQRGSFVDPK